jgi:hypothetical protein
MCVDPASGRGSLSWASGSPVGWKAHPASRNAWNATSEADPAHTGVLYEGAIAPSCSPIWSMPVHARTCRSVRPTVVAGFAAIRHGAETHDAIGAATRRDQTRPDATREGTRPPPLDGLRKARQSARSIRTPEQPVPPTTWSAPQPVARLRPILGGEPARARLERTDRSSRTPLRHARTPSRCSRRQAIACASIGAWRHRSIHWGVAQGTCTIACWREQRRPDVMDRRFRRRRDRVTRAHTES